MFRFVLIAAMVASLSAAALAGDGRLEISQQQMPFVLTNSGSYVVTENLKGSAGSNGITIAASDVTLDLNGFSLAGAPGSLSGIAVSGKRINVIIKNGVVREWGQSGIQGLSASNAAVQSVQAYRCGVDGLQVGTGWTLFECEASDNGRDGISAQDISLLTQCLARNNARYGIVAGDYCLLESCSARENASVGIKFGQVGGAVQAVSRGNGSSGIEPGAGSLISDATVHQNATNGVNLFMGGVKVQRLTAYGNAGFGLYSVAPSTFVEDSAFRANTNGGIRLSSMSFALNNHVDSSVLGPGIEVTGTATRVEANHATFNQIGFSISGTNHVIVKNTAYRNATTNYIVQPPTNFFQIVVNPIPTNGFDEAWGSYDLF